MFTISTELDGTRVVRCDRCSESTTYRLGQVLRAFKATHAAMHTKEPR